MTEKSGADVEAKLVRFQTRVKARFQDLEGKFSSLADLKEDAAKRKAESNRRHKELKILILNLVPNPTLKSMEAEIKEEQRDAAVGSDEKSTLSC